VGSLHSNSLESCLYSNCGGPWRWWGRRVATFRQLARSAWGTAAEDVSLALRLAAALAARWLLGFYGTNNHQHEEEEERTSHSGKV
jgi:hypothetical protein